MWRQLKRKMGMHRLAEIILVMLIIQYSDGGIIQKQPTYSILVPSHIRPNLAMKISATIIRLEYESVTITAVVKRLSHDGSTSEAVCNGKHTFTREGTIDITMRTPQEMTAGNYTIRVSGFSHPSFTGQIFSNETELFFDKKQVSVFIITSKPFYNRGELVAFKVIPIQRNMMPITDVMDIRVKDPVGNVLKIWYAQHTNAGGIVSLAYRLNRLFPRYGKWTIEVIYRKSIFSKQFQIDEFYLPIQYVNMTMPTSMSSDAVGIAGKADCVYTTFRAVRGNATIKLDIISKASDQKYPQITRMLDYFFGTTDFMFSRQEMEAVVGGPNSLIGKEVKVTVCVKEWVLNTTGCRSQSAIVYSKDAEIRFLEGGVMTFKPGQPFSVHVVAQYGDGSPILPHNPNRTIYLDIVESDDNIDDLSRSQTVKLSVKDSVAEIWLNPRKTTNRFFVTARYENLQDTRRELVATRYWSPSKSYLHLTTTTERPRVKEYMNFHIITNTFVDIIYYTILAGGNIISSERMEMHTRSKQLSIAISQDMVPSARIVAYFITPEGQVVTDSLNFHVEPNPGHQVSVSINKGKDLSLNTIELKLAADPLSYVAFGAMEYQLYDLGTRNSLTKEEVVNELYTYDGHANRSIFHTWERNGQYAGSYSLATRSFGHDANTTFFYSGLYIFTDANVSSVFTHCNISKGDFPCMDGKTCYNYRDICTGSAECAADHRDEMGCFNKTKPVILYNDVHWREKGIRSNSANPGFLWSEQYIKPDGMLQLNFPVINYPSSWVVTALAMSREHGLSILEKPVLFDGIRPVFIRVEAPGSIKLYEHLSLSIVVFNRWTEPQDILIVLPKTKDYDPVNWNRETNEAEIGSGEHQILVPTLPNTERQLYVPITFNTVGTVTVTIEVMSSVGYFKHTRKVKVTWQGVPELYITNYQVDLRRANSEKTPDFLIPVREQVIDPENRIMNHVAGSAKSTIYVVGDIIGVGFAPEFKNYLTGRKLADSPDYSCDNAVFSFAMNFYSLKILRSLSTATQAQVDGVLNALNLGIQEIFSHQEPDGSFRTFRWSSLSSTWVTAHFVEIMSDVKTNIRDFFRFVAIPQEPLDRAALWLTNQRGLLPGVVTEAGNINNKWLESKLMVNVDGVMTPSNISLTALTVIALSKSKQDDQETKRNVTAAKNEGANYISQFTRRIEDPFEMAIVTYALTVAGHVGKSEALVRLKEMRRTANQGQVYWSTMEIPPMKLTVGLDTQLRLLPKAIYNVTGYSVSATSYALYAYILNSQPEAEIDKIQKFLQEQRMNIGGWTSSYDTLIAVQALSALAEMNQDRNAYEMNFVFRSDQVPNWSKTVHLHRGNWFIPQKVSLPSHWGTVQTYARGHGIALVQMKTTVNYEHQTLFRKSAADYFDINFELTTSGFNHSHLHYKICPVWKGPGERSGVAMVDFTVPSGYVLPNGGLQVTVRKTSYINTVRNGEARGSQTTVYFDYFDRTLDNCIKLNAQRRRTASNITQNHRVRVYDFFEPGIYTQKIIDKIEFNKLTVCLSCGSYQCPWCPDYAAAHTNLANVYLISALVTLLLVCLRRDELGKLLGLAAS